MYAFGMVGSFASSSLMSRRERWVFGANSACKRTIEQSLLMKTGPMKNVPSRHSRQAQKKVLLYCMAVTSRIWCPTFALACRETRKRWDGSVHVRVWDKLDLPQQVELIKSFVWFNKTTKWLVGIRHNCDELENPTDIFTSYSDMFCVTFLEVRVERLVLPKLAPSDPGIYLTSCHLAVSIVSYGIIKIWMIILLQFLVVLVAEFDTIVDR